MPEDGMAGSDGRVTVDRLPLVEGYRILCAAIYGETSGTIGGGVFVLENVIAVRPLSDERGDAVRIHGDVPASVMVQIVEGVSVQIVVFVGGCVKVSVRGLQCEGVGHGSVSQCDDGHLVGWRGQNKTVFDNGGARAVVVLMLCRQRISLVRGGDEDFVADSQIPGVGNQGPRVAIRALRQGKSRPCPPQHHQQ